ncbi:hypothetical protein SAMN05216315_11125 [Nitrosospira sp. Nsp18]|nr:hypothetical protein SAMN05216315_11125 [Nitrosospira sp. Nsp18]
MDGADGAEEADEVPALCFWQQCLYFRPLLHGHGSLREIFFIRSIVIHNRFEIKPGHRWHRPWNRDTNIGDVQKANWLIVSPAIP